MAIESILSQPTANGIYAAYRPVVFRVSASRTDGDPIPPVVYCDVYFNDIFYKTLSKSQYTELNEDDSEWEFDIQDAAQEFLEKFLGANGATTIVEASPIITKASCKFRSSGYTGGSSSGFVGVPFIEPEDTAPVQGTDSSDPVSGTGTSSVDFYIVNSTLQHADNQDLATHLFYFKKRTWASSTLPLSHRPEYYRIGPYDSDIFPIIYSGANAFKKLRLYYKLCGLTTFTPVELNVGPEPSCNAIISQPIALENGLGWLISWNLIAGSPQKYHVSTPAVSGGAPSETISTQWQYTTGQLPEGTHIITVRPLCFIDGVWYFGASQTVQLIVGGCTNVDIPAQELPDAVVGVAYNVSITVNGTQPIVLSDEVKPAWMTMAVVGNSVNLTGTPDVGDIGSDIEVSFHASNCGDSGGLGQDFADSIDVFDDPESGINSSLINTAGESSSNILLMKSSAPFEILLNFQPMPNMVIIEFHCPDYIGADFILSIADFTPGAGVLNSDGVDYNGIVTPNHIAWSGVDVVNGMTITLT